MIDDGITMILTWGGCFLVLAIVHSVLEWRRHRSAHPTRSSPDRPRSVSLPAISTAQAERQRWAFEKIQADMIHEAKVERTLERLNVRTEDEMPRRSER